MSDFGSPTPIVGTLEEHQFQLDGILVTVSNGTFIPLNDWYFAVWDDAGNQIVDNTNFPDPDSDGVLDIEVIWHVRDDGDGAFTMFFLSGPNTGRVPTMQSFDADGTLLDSQTYELPTRMIDVFGVPVEQTLLEAFATAVDLDGGGIAAFNYDGVLGTGHNVVFYNADGTIDSRTEWTPTITGLGAGALGGTDMVRSGDNLFVFHLNTGLSVDEEFEVYGRVIGTDGSFVTDEFRVSEDDHVRGTFGFGSGGVDAETLADGKVVVAYSTSKDGVSDPGTLDVFCKIYNPDGSVFAAEQMVNATITAEQQGQARVHALADGGFAITYNTNDYVAFENTGVIQCFDSSGAPVGDPLLLPTRFDAADTSVIFENGFAYVSGIGTPLYTVTLGVDGAGNTVIEGTSAGEALDGTSGDDVITAKGGKDTVEAGAGDDEVTGGNGKDKLKGQDGDDTLSGGSGHDTVKGGNGDDSLSGGDGNDSIAGGKGKDSMTGSDGDDSLAGGKGQDTLKGGAGADFLEGEDSADQLLGGKGKDTLKGQNGSDTLDGGKGNDRMVGGGKDDVFVFSAGKDKITDFDALSDGEVIDLSDVDSITGFNDLKNKHMSQQGDDVVIDDLEGNTLTLLDVSLSDLDKADFLF